MLVKSVLEAILAYWMSLSWIPKENPGAYPLTLLLFPLELEQGPFRYALGSLGKNCDFKGAGRLGLKNIFHFSKALAAKCVQVVKNNQSIDFNNITEIYSTKLDFRLGLISEQKPH